jgi:hypothetical protein
LTGRVARRSAAVGAAPGVEVGGGALEDAVDAEADGLGSASPVDGLLEKNAVHATTRTRAPPIQPPVTIRVRVLTKPFLWGWEQVIDSPRHPVGTGARVSVMA